MSRVKSGTYLVKSFSRAAVHEEPAALYDSHKRDQQNRQELHHGPDFPDPRGQVEVPRVRGPIKHLVETSE